jgi:hypothetical protein
MQALTADELRLRRNTKPERNKVSSMMKKILVDALSTKT